VKINRTDTMQALNLAVPQFTLYGDVSRGKRPGFEQAARPELARPLFAAFCADLAARGIPLATGCFGADMQVSLTNDGPVTFILDSALRLSETQRANRARTPGVREGKERSRMIVYTGIPS
jgi:D-tyrosyl-tRNA(Tyr) deacylase